MRFRGLFIQDPVLNFSLETLTGIRNGWVRLTVGIVGLVAETFKSWQKPQGNKMQGSWKKYFRAVNVESLKKKEKFYVLRDKCTGVQ
jgi:hypothetical protein